MERLNLGYLLVTKFPSEGEALEACDRISEFTNRLQEEGHSPNLFAREFGTGIGIDKNWHVLIAGDKPDRYTEEQIEQYLSSGEPTAMSLDVLSLVLLRMDAELDGWMGGWRRSRPPADHD